MKGTWNYLQNKIHGNKQNQKIMKQNFHRNLVIQFLFEVL